MQYTRLPVNMNTNLLGAVITRYISLVRSTLRALSSDEIQKLHEFIDKCPGRLFLIGNGGSWANCQVFASLLNSLERCRAFCLGIDFTGMSASANFSGGFASTLRLYNPSSEDRVLFLSGSGNSEDLFPALELAKRKGCAVFALGSSMSDDTGGQLGAVCEEDALIVPCNRIEAVEDIHSFILWVIFESLRENVRSIKSLWTRTCQSYGDWCSESTSGELAEVALNMTLAALHGSRLILPALGAAAEHMWSDLGQGLLGACPIAGAEVHNFLSTAEGTARGNDLGAERILDYKLARTQSGPDDIALVPAFSALTWALDGVSDTLESRKGPNYWFIDEDRFSRLTISDRRARIINCRHLVEAAGPQFAISALGHALIVAVRDQGLYPLFEPEEIDDSNMLDRISTALRGQGRPGNKRSIETEISLGASVIPDGKMLSFANRKPHFVRDPLQVQTELREFFGDDFNLSISRA